MNNYTEKDLSINIINKYKDKYKTLKHIRFNKDTKGKCLFDKNNLIGIIQVDIKRQYILALEVFDPYKRKGYGGVLLKIAESKLNANKLSVNKKIVQLFHYINKMDGKFMMKMIICFI